MRPKQNSFLVLNLVSVKGGKILDSISIKNSAAPISVWTLQHIFLTVNFACCFHREESMVEKLKKVKLLAIDYLVVLTFLDASDSQISLGIWKTVVLVPGVEVEGEQIAAVLETIAVFSQHLHRLVENFFVLEDHHIADVAVFHCAASLGKDLKEVKPQVEATIASNLDLSLIIMTCREYFGMILKTNPICLSESEPRLRYCSARLEAN
jgi:hypothetical protein